MFSGLGSEPNLDELGNMLKGVAEHIESNPDIKAEIDGLTNDLFSQDVMMESMVELRDKLRVYLD
jgi:hypothetical protein